MNHKVGMTQAMGRRLPLLSSGRSGFTLLEILAVIFIVSLVSVLVFPSFAGFGEKGIRSEARKIASLLRYLNDSAIYTKQTYPLTFDFSDGSLGWKDPEGEKTDRMKTLFSVDLQSRGELKEGQVTVFFGPTGGQEFIKVRLKDGEKGLTVAFNPASGRTKIIEAQ